MQTTIHPLTLDNNIIFQDVFVEFQQAWEKEYKCLFKSICQYQLSTALTLILKFSNIARSKLDSKFSEVDKTSDR